MFIIKWYYRNNPTVKGQGTKPTSEVLAQAWVDYGNAEFPEIFHYYEKV